MLSQLVLTCVVEYLFFMNDKLSVKATKIISLQNLHGYCSIPYNYGKTNLCKDYDFLENLLGSQLVLAMHAYFKIDVLPS